MHDMLPSTRNKIAAQRQLSPINGSQAQLIVPHNSLTNIRQKMQLNEHKIPSNAAPNNNAIKQKTTKQKPSDTVCPHCENLAKNFLYLESLVRLNFDKKYPCSLCQATLKYLEYMNGTIIETFSKSVLPPQAATSGNTFVGRHQLTLPGATQGTSNTKTIVRSTNSKPNAAGQKSSKKAVNSMNKNPNTGLKFTLKKNKSKAKAIKKVSSVTKKASNKVSAAGKLKASTCAKRPCVMTTRMLLQKILGSSTKQSIKEKSKKTKNSKKNHTKNVRKCYK